MVSHWKEAECTHSIALQVMGGGNYTKKVTFNLSWNSNAQIININKKLGLLTPIMRNLLDKSLLQGVLFFNEDKDDSLECRGSSHTISTWKQEELSDEENHKPSPQWVRAGLTRWTWWVLGCQTRLHRDWGRKCCQNMMALDWSSTMRRNSVLAERKEGHSSLHQHWGSKRANPIWHQYTEVKLVTKREMLAGAHSRWILIIQGAQSHVVLLCFVSIVLRMKVLIRTTIQSVVCLGKIIPVMLKFSWERWQTWEGKTAIVQAMGDRVWS